MGNKKQLLMTVMEMEKVTNLQQSTIAMEIARADKKLVDGAEESLQLLSVLAVMAENMVHTRT